MKILGIDPGTARLGFAIVETMDFSHQYSLLECGIIATSKFQAEHSRLHEIRNDLTTIIDKFQPDVLSIEELFFFKNLSTVIPVAQSRGVLLELAEAKALSIFEYTPLQIKQVITGNGKASKAVVEHFVMEELQIQRKIKPDDAVDAVAIALCFLRSDYQKFVRMPN